MPILIKIHERVIREGERGVLRRILAICDSSLLGKVFEEGENTLDLETYRNFYDGKNSTEREVAELIDEFENINIVGEESINAAKKSLKINEKNIKRIAGIPHLQIYKI